MAMGSYIYIKLMWVSSKSSSGSHVSCWNFWVHTHDPLSLMRLVKESLMN